DDAHEQLRRAVDRLGARGFRRHLRLWNDRSIMIVAAYSPDVKQERQGDPRETSGVSSKGRPEKVRQERAISPLRRHLKPIALFSPAVRRIRDEQVVPSTGK